MSDTPETDAAVKDSNGQWSFVLKETCQRLERERDEAREHLAAIKHYLTKERDDALAQIVQAECRAERFCQERDEAREALENHMAATIHTCHDECKRPVCVLRRERDEAKKKNEDYFHWVNELVNERDELKKIVEQRILAGAEIHDKANSLLKQSNRTEAECESLRKQLTAATSALRQIHLEVGDWIRSTIIVEE